MSGEMSIHLRTQGRGDENCSRSAFPKKLMDEEALHEVFRYPNFHSEVPDLSRR